MSQTNVSWRIKFKLSISERRFSEKCIAATPNNSTYIFEFGVFAHHITSNCFRLIWFYLHCGIWFFLVKLILVYVDLCLSLQLIIFLLMYLCHWFSLFLFSSLSLSLCPYLLFIQLISWLPCSTSPQFSIELTKIYQSHSLPLPPPVSVESFSQLKN